MRKKSNREEVGETKMDMTPMIDCVFQLIVFFFLIIDLQNQELELLKLPVAKYAQPDEPPEGVRPIVNLNQDGDVIYRGKTYYSHKDENNFDDLKKLLKYFADSLMRKKFDDVVGKELPDDPLLIRADEFTEMHYVAKVMQACGDLNILIWKVELAVGEPKDNQRGGGNAGSNQ
jgi:biopolymer transport protein ExbD